MLRGSNTSWRDSLNTVLLQCVRRGQGPCQDKAWPHAEIGCEGFIQPDWTRLADSILMSVQGLLCSLIFREVADGQAARVSAADCS